MLCVVGLGVSEYKLVIFKLNFRQSSNLSRKFESKHEIGSELDTVSTRFLVR